MSQIKQKLPNSTGALVLGILSIVFSFCYAVPGLIMGIIALVLANKSIKLHNENPEMYDGFSNAKAGKVTGIIGLVLAAIVLVVFIIIIVSVGSLGALMLNDFM